MVGPSLMHSVSVVARQTFPYAGLTRHAGDTFEATAQDARVLTLIGKVAPIVHEDEPTIPEAAEPSDDTPRRRRRRAEPVPDPLVE